MQIGGGPLPLFAPVEQGAVDGVLPTQLLHQVVQVTWGQVHDRGRLDGRAHPALLLCKGLRAGMIASSKVSL
jgi:hypothetical protein